MWTSTAASGFGDRMIMLAALALLGGMAQTADSAGILASTQFFFFLPYLIFNIVGGWLADHLPRKWLLLACDESRGMILLGSFLLLLSATGDATQPAGVHWKVYAALSAIGTFAAIFNPTRNAIVPQIVPLRQLQSSNAIILVINVVASMVGMIVGTKLIIDTTDVSTVRTGLILGSAFYIVSGMFFAFMRPINVLRPQTTQRRTLAQATQYARNHRRTVTLILLNTMVWSAAAVVATGVMGVLKIHYGLTGEVLFEKYGLVAALMGTGMLVGAGIVVIVSTRRESPILLAAGLFLSGLCTMVFGAIPWLPVTYLSAFGVGVFGNIAIIAAITILQAICPNYIRGRIMGLNALINTGFAIVVYGIIWQIPNADYWVLVIMLVLGPVLMAVGLTAQIRYLRSGPMPNKMANAFWRLVRLFSFSWHGLSVRGKHHIPADGPVVIVANHTTAMDPFLIQAATIRMVRWLMLTSYRMKVGNLLWNAIDPICIEHDLGNNERGNAMRQIRQIVAELKKGHVVGMFPEGALQRDSRELKEFEDGAAVVARLAGAQIVPCWIDGTVLSTSLLRHALTPTQSSVSFGEPFKPSKSDSPQSITAELKRRIIELGEQEAARRADES